jgi:hypothetical protein
MTGHAGPVIKKTGGKNKNYDCIYIDEEDIFPVPDYVHGNPDRTAEDHEGGTE